MAGCIVNQKEYAQCTITITYDKTTSQGTLMVTGQNKIDPAPTTLLESAVVVGGDGHVTPTGKYHAARWEKDHTSTKYGHLADTPYSKTLLAEMPSGLTSFIYGNWTAGVSTCTALWGQAGIHRPW